MGYRKFLPFGTVLVSVLALACSQGVSSAPDGSTAQRPETTVAPADRSLSKPAPTAQSGSQGQASLGTEGLGSSDDSTPAPTATPEPSMAPADQSLTESAPTTQSGSQGQASLGTDGLGSSDDSTPAPTATPEPTPTPTSTPRPRDPLDEPPPEYLTFGWKTNFSKHSVPYSEIISGGPLRDQIPPIDDPKYVDVAGAPENMREDEPVVSLEIDGDARAYPLAILIWHEVVNDEVGGVPVTVTYCPLCNTAIVFDRRVGGRVLDFGTSGKVRNSDLVMWDRQTESWWQQITGEAIVGDLTGTKLDFIPASLVSWKEFVAAHPDGRLLSRDTGFRRDYDEPPYAGYDGRFSRPFLFFGDIDPRIQPMERVVGLSVGEEAIAYPFSLLEEHPVINDTVGGKDLVVFYTGGTLSAFAGGLTSQGRRVVGSTGVFEPSVDGRKLTFKADGDVIVDEETGSEWSILGQAVEGPLAGSQLTPVVHANHFWFAWFAFYPDTAVPTADDLG